MDVETAANMAGLYHAMMETNKHFGLMQTLPPPVYIEKPLNKLPIIILIIIVLFLVGVIAYMWGKTSKKPNRNDIIEVNKIESSVQENKTDTEISTKKVKSEQPIQYRAMNISQHRSQ